MQRHLVVMARSPRLGTGKRRLAKDIGILKAHIFYRHTTGRLLRDLGASPKWHLWLAVTPDKDALAVRGLWPFRGQVIPQGGGDLGDRMGRLMASLPPGPAVIIGSDIPGIDPDKVTAAFQALGSHDWVIGPAVDGGYWLIGARRCPSLRLPFQSVRWSCEYTRSDTIAGLGGQSVKLLETLEDIDDGAAWSRWRAKIQDPARCSFKRGINSTKLQGRWRESN